MPFKIQEFTSEVMKRGELLRNNKFHVQIAIPKFVRGESGSRDDINTIRYMEFYCHRAHLPGVAFKTHQAARYGYGPDEQRPFIPMYQDANLWIYNDTKNRNLSFFREWINFIQPFDMSKGIPTNSQDRRVYSVAYKEDYTTEVIITVFSEDGKARNKLFLRDAFPKYLNTQMLDWADHDTPQTFEISFGYNDWFEDKLIQQVSLP